MGFFCWVWVGGFWGGGGLGVEVSRLFVRCGGVDKPDPLVRAGIRVRVKFKQPLYVFMCAVCAGRDGGAREVGTGTIGVCIVRSVRLQKQRRYFSIRWGWGCKVLCIY